jgi:ATP-binding cassette subfamily B protein
MPEPTNPPWQLCWRTYTLGLEQTSPLRRLWNYAADHQRRMIKATLYSFLNKAFDLGPPLLIGLAIDVVVLREKSFLSGLGVESLKSQIVMIAVLTFLVWGFESLFQYLYGIEWRGLAQAIQHNLRTDTYDQVQKLEVSYFEDHSTGNLLTVLNDDVNQLERFLDRGANEVIQVTTTLVLIGAYFFYIAPTVAWMSFLPIPFILWASFKFQRGIQPRYGRVRRAAGGIATILSNNLSGMTTIKAFNAEERENARVEAESKIYLEANEAAIKLSAAFSPLIRMVVLTGFIATMIAGGFLTLDGTLKVSLFSTMVFLTQRLLWPFTMLGQTFDLYQLAMASTSRVLDVYDTKPTLLSGTNQLARDSVEGDIAFEHVSFAYVEGFPVLRDLNFTLPARQTSAFVGATGSGKTTLVKLLLRFYDPVDGEITLDGHSLPSLLTADLRQALGVVGQDVFLFHGTVRENIAYGKPEASENDIVAAAKSAEAHEFILSLPQQYETVVGERGQKLSGGQRQRISIARAVLTDPPVLVLDEATSAVDNETEAAIQRSLARIAVDRTTVVIAHRLSTIRHAHQIFVLDNGVIAERGTHEDLLELDGTYAGLWKVQTGEAVQ